MGVTDVVFGQDIVLDEGAFAQAVSDFAALEENFQQIRKNIEHMLNTVKPGFDTPAGRKLVAACEGKLLEPMDAQTRVLKRMSTTLQQSKEAYESVFRAYEELQAAINQANN